MHRRHFLTLSASWSGYTLLQGAGGAALGSLWPASSLAQGLNQPTLPSNADVIFSSRAAHPNSAEMFRSFGATRSEWTYDSGSDYVKQMRQFTSQVGLSLNANLGTPDNTGAALGMDGKPLIAPWMASWGAIWLSSQRLAARAAIFGRADSCLHAGATSVQFDDPGLEYEAIPFAGGDWSPDAIANFAKYISNTTSQDAEVRNFRASGANMLQWMQSTFSARAWTPAVRQEVSKRPLWGLWEEFLLESVLGFHRQVKARLAGSEYRALYSFNIGNLNPSLSMLAFAEVPDYIIGEIQPPVAAAQCAICVATARMFKKPYIGTPVLINDGLLRETIALLYALGENSIIPWDSFIGLQVAKLSAGATPPANVQSGRYFANPGNYSDIYKFVHDQADQLRQAGPLAEVALLISSYSDTDPPRLLTAAVADCLSVGVLPAIIVELPNGEFLGAKQFASTPLLVIDLRTKPVALAPAIEAHKILNARSQPFSIDMLTEVTRLDTRLPKGWNGVIRAGQGNVFVHLVRSSGEGAPQQLPGTFAIRLSENRLKSCNSLHGTVATLGQAPAWLGSGDISGTCARLTVRVPSMPQNVWTTITLGAST